MINVTGVSESRVAPAAAYYANQKDQSIIIVSTDVRAKRLASDLSFFVQDKEIIAPAGGRTIPAALCGQKSRSHAYPPASASRRCVPVGLWSSSRLLPLPSKNRAAQQLRKSSFRLRLGEEVDLDKIKAQAGGAGL